MRWSTDVNECYIFVSNMFLNSGAESFTCRSFDCPVLLLNVAITCTRKLQGLYSFCRVFLVNLCYSAAC